MELPSAVVDDGLVAVPPCSLPLARVFRRWLRNQEEGWLKPQ